jgi:hypothetical protein
MRLLWVVLGGSGFMGIHLLQKLLELRAVDTLFVHKILVANRGTAHWVGATPLIPRSDTASFLSHCYVDWDASPQALTEALVALRVSIQSICNYPHADSNGPTRVVLVDLSCTEPQWMHRWLNTAVSHLIRGNLVHKYIYISTDSVYDATKTGVQLNDDASTTPQGVGASEDDLVVVTPPLRTFDGAEDLASSSSTSSSSTSASSSSSSDSLTYGEEKRYCENLLEDAFSTRVALMPEEGAGNPRLQTLIMLRLPDVVGPFDTSGRFLATMMWLQVQLHGTLTAYQQSELQPSPLSCVIPLPRTCAQSSMSIVLASDVADAILMFAQNTPTESATDRQHIFHVACRHPTTLAQMLEHIAHRLWTSTIERLPSMTVPSYSPAIFIQLVDDDCVEFTPDFYPSVDCGPLSVARYLEEALTHE